MSDFYDAPKSPAERLFEHLVGGRRDDLSQLFVEKPNVNDPIDGPVTGVDAIAKMMNSSAVWSNIKRTECIVRITRIERAMAEFICQVQAQDNVIPMFVTTYADLKNGRISEARVYYNTNLIGLQIRRKPILHSDPTICFPNDQVGAYHKALHAGDLEGVLARFEPEGYFKGPSGSYFRGQKDLRALFANFFFGGDGIMLRYTSLTDDGLTLAIEYNYECWGTSLFPTEAGCAVYERGPSGKILRGRSCDQIILAPVGTLAPSPQNPEDWGPLADNPEIFESAKNDKNVQ